MTDALALYTVAELRAVEQAAQAQLPPHTLMQRAGRAAAQWALELAPGADARVLAVAGPGNNGGDALEAALCLCQAGLDAQVLLLADANQLSGDALLAWQRAEAAAVPIHDASSAASLFSQSWDLVLDGLFGIGLTRAIEGDAARAVEAINCLPCPVLALDIPSGLNADNGQAAGKGPAVHASHTLSFIAGKPGLYTGAARDHVGELRIADLQIEPSLFPAARSHAIGLAGFSAFLKARAHDSHKGSYGDVIVLGGAHGMTGAPVLGARAALHCGAGRVHIAFIDPGLAADAGQPELMCRDAADMDFDHAVTVAGPGMGQERHACDQLARALSCPAPLVLDADALNLLASESGLRARVRARRAPTLITPHPLEAARLLGSSAQAVQADRMQAARQLAEELNAVAILKGSGSVIARPDGQAAINTTGNPSLATAGSGDVLAGVCGALLAQGWPAWEAALGATWMHGAAADRLVAEGAGPIGLVASELITALRQVLNELVAQAGKP